MSDTKRYVLYARKSTESEDRQVLSIPAQLKELYALATRSGIDIAEELTESCSAREPGRPVFSQLLKDVAAARVHGILCWKLDRLARNPIDGGALTHYLGKGLLQEIVTPDGRHDGTGDSKFMLSVLFGAATKYTDDLSVAVKRGNRELCERGGVPGNPPLGYTKVHDDPRREGAGKVVPDPERFHLMKGIWKDLATGTMSVAEAWRRAVEKGLTTRPTRKNPSHPVTLTHLYQVLDSKFYTGLIVRKGELFQGEHEPMVTLEEFERVQRFVRRKDGPRPSVHRFLYSGLLRCGDCTRLLIGEDIKNRYGQHYTYYRCGRRRHGFAVCRAPAPTEKQVTADVERALEAATLPKPLVDWTLSAIDVWARDQRGHALALSEAKKVELRRAEQEHRRLTDLVVAGTLADEDYVERRAASLARLEDLRRGIENPTGQVEAWQQAVTEFVTFSGMLTSGFAAGDTEGRRRLIGQLYENLVVIGRITKPVLRSDAQLLDGKYPLAHSPEPGDANLPPPSRIVLNQRKNARRSSARERAFSQWWTRVYNVRTFGGKGRNEGQEPLLTPAARLAAPSQIREDAL